MSTKTLIEQINQKFSDFTMEMWVLPPPTRNVFLANIVDEPKICRCPAINLLSTGHDAGCPEKKR